MRFVLAVSAACAVSACAGGTQQTLPTPNNAALTPQTGARLTTTLSADRSTSNEKREAEGGDDGNGTVVYSSIPKPLKAVASVGFEAYQGLELGDGVNLTHTGKLQRVRYVLSSWGCQHGNWYSNNCVTTGSPTFPVPFTINVYAVDNTQPSHVGALLKTQTQTFNIPFRPSSTPARCPQGTDAHPGERFYSAVDAACIHGLANVIVFDFSAPRVSLPAKTIVSLVYNTSHYGPHPIGESAPCYSTSAGCGYDSLNISTDGPGGPIGSPVDPNGIFVSFTQALDYCRPSDGLGFRLDTTPCTRDSLGGPWTGYHPQFEVRVGSGGDGDDNHHDDNHREGHDD
jgi:hypothetical protein